VAETQIPRPAVFLDRDGTICEEVGYLNHPGRFRLFPFAGKAICRLNGAGFAVIVVTNQSGVARGYFPLSLVHEVHERMRNDLLAEGARIEGVYFCPHGGSEDCSCRKPKTGMIEQAARDLFLDVSRSFVIGDRYGDMELAFRAGMRAVFVRTGYGLGEWTWHAQDWPRQPDAVVDDLVRAVDWILEHKS